MPEEKTVSLDKVLSDAMDDRFWAIRGKAIAAYANVEQALCWLFALLAGMERVDAEVIFYRITNPRVVGEILVTLLKRKHADTYSEFWKSLDKFLRELVATRNRLVHWKVTTTVTGEGFAGLALVTPDYQSRDPKMEEQVDADKLIDFIDRCDFAARLCTMFHIFLDPQVRQHMTAERQQVWHEIFQQRVTYPPPCHHPLYQTPAHKPGPVGFSAGSEGRKNATECG